MRYLLLFYQFTATTLHDDISELAQKHHHTALEVEIQHVGQEYPPKRHSGWNSAALVPMDPCLRRCTPSPSAARVAGARVGPGVKIGGCTQKAWTPVL